jgi:RND family efflux transporter MFP subunit
VTADLRGLSIERGAPPIPPPPRRLGTRLALPLALLAGTAGAILFAARDALWPAAQVRVEPVVAAAGTPHAAATLVTAPGWIAPDPFPIQVPALTSGVVAEVLALDGARVEAGEVLARLVPDEARLAVARAQAVRAAARAAVDAVEAERPGLAAAVEAAAASVEVRVTELALKRPLAADQLLSATAIAELEARLRHAEAEQAAASARLPALEARLAGARAGLAVAEVDLGIAELALARTEVRAPGAGIVLRRLATPGAAIGAPGSASGAVVAELYDPEHLLVRVDVPFADAARVGVGQRALVTVEALPDRSFAGRVVRAVQTADLAKNTVAFQVALDATDPALRPDMIARVRLLAADDATGTDAGAGPTLFVPRAALRGDLVLAVIPVGEDRGRIAVRQVRTGAERDGHVAIEGEVRPGDRVVVEGPADLAEGQLVEILGGGGR